MARGRLISRTLGSSRKFAALHRQANGLGEFAGELYPLLVAHADDFGRQAGDAFTVKMAVFPVSPRSEWEFELALEGMHTVGLVQRYRVDGRDVIQITDFDQHQPGLHKRSSSKFQPPPELTQAQLELCHALAYSDRTLILEVPSEEKGTEGKGREENVRTPPLTRREVPTDPREGFDAFWAVYPKKRSRSDAEKAWRKLAPSPELRQRILDAVAVQRVDPRWLEDKGRFVPYPATWLNGHRWEDETTDLWVRAVGALSPTVVVEHDWFEECKRLHDLRCNGRGGHLVQMQLDRTEKAG